jgi:hypothetical protein
MHFQKAARSAVPHSCLHARGKATGAYGDPLGREPPQRHGWMSLFDQRRRNMAAQFKRCLLAGKLRRANDFRDQEMTRMFYNTYVTVTSPVGVSRFAVGICVHHSTLRKLAGRAIVRCSACSLGDTSSPPAAACPHVSGLPCHPQSACNVLCKASTTHVSQHHKSCDGV